MNKPFTTSSTWILILSVYFHTKQSTIIDAVETSSGEIEIGPQFLPLNPLLFGVCNIIEDVLIYALITVCHVIMRAQFIQKTNDKESAIFDKKEINALNLRQKMK